MRLPPVVPADSGEDTRDMAEVVCADGSVLVVLPVPCVDRDGAAYEATLRLLRDGAVFGEVGQRCAFFLAATATRLRAARDAAGPDAFPTSSLEAGLLAWLSDHGDVGAQRWSELEHYLPRDRELFAFLARDPDDVATAGELRAWLRSERTWESRDGGPGRWTVQHRAVLEAWGAGGTGVRAVLDSTALLALLDELLAECARLGVGPDRTLDLRGVRRPVG